MNIEVNLLPDVKQEYIKAEHSRRLVISVSVIVIIASVGLLVLLLSASALQKKHINDLTTDIKKYSDELKSKPQISKILTVQNQLQSLTALHDEKPAASRVFDYLNQTTPTVVDISSFKVDFTSKTVTISGNADSLSAVNKYIDTLKFTSYKSANGSSTKAFSNVVMTTFGVSSGDKGSRPASYTITFNYDPVLFDVTKSARLSVPAQTTTRPTASSAELFTDVKTNSNTNGNGR